MRDLHFTPKRSLGLIHGETKSVPAPSEGAKASTSWVEGDAFGGSHPLFGSGCTQVPKQEPWRKVIGRALSSLDATLSRVSDFRDDAALLAGPRDRTEASQVEAQALAKLSKSIGALVEDLRSAKTEEALRRASGDVRALFGSKLERLVADLARVPGIDASELTKMLATLRTPDGYPADRLFAAADRNVDLSRITPPGHVWRTDNYPLIRVDHRGPDEIFERGFHTKDSNPTTGNYDLDTHVSEATDGPFVSTSYAHDVGAEAPSRWEYEIVAPGGIDLAKSPGVRENPGESEIAFPGGIDRRFIKSVQGYDPFTNAPVGERQYNAHYEEWRAPDEPLG